MIYIGIDVSKDSFVAAYPAKRGYCTKTFNNDTKGVRQFIKSLPEESHCVMEATGNYSMLLLYLLQHANIPQMSQRCPIVVPKPPGNLWEFLRKSVHRYNLFVKKQQKVSHSL